MKDQNYLQLTIMRKLSNIIITIIKLQKTLKCIVYDEIKLTIGNKKRIENEKIITNAFARVQWYKKPNWCCYRVKIIIEKT